MSVGAGIFSQPAGSCRSWREAGEETRDVKTVDRRIGYPFGGRNGEMALFARFIVLVAVMRHPVPARTPGGPCCLVR